MKKMFMVLMIALFSIALFGQVKTQQDIFKKIPKEIKELLPKDGSLVKYDGKVKIAFEKFKEVLQALESESYQLTAQKPKGADVNYVQAPFWWELRCMYGDYPGCGYRIPCGCTWVPWCPRIDSCPSGCGGHMVIFVGWCGGEE